MFVFLPSTEFGSAIYILCLHFQPLKIDLIALSNPLAKWAFRGESYLEGQISPGLVAATEINGTGTSPTWPGQEAAEEIWCGLQNRFLSFTDGLFQVLRV